MGMATTAPPRPAAGELPGPMPRREQWAFVVFATWAVTGLFIDGWSHIHDKPETFFTPWHLVLYSGFGAGVVWSGIEALRQARKGNASSVVGTAGSRLTAVGIGLFALGGIGDGLWHTLFGIEVDLAALLSPTHLLLMTGGVLLVTGPLRSSWATDTETAPTFAAFFPTLVSATISTALVSFFLMWETPLRLRWLGGREIEDSWAASTYLVTTVLMLGATLFLLRRWRTPPGSFTFLFTVVALLETGLEGWRLVGLAVGPILAGIAIDVIVARVGDARNAARLIGLAAPAVMWLPTFVALAADGRFHWSVHLWVGITFLSTVTGVGLSVLAFPPASAVRLRSP